MFFFDFFFYVVVVFVLAVVSSTEEEEEEDLRLPRTCCVSSFSRTAMWTGWTRSC